MKRLSLALAAALTGVAPTAGAEVFIYTITTPIASNGETGSGVVRELTIPAGSTVTGFGWDVELQANEPSWYSEMQVVFGVGTPNVNKFTLTPADSEFDDRGTGSGPPLEFSSGRIFGIGELFDLQRGQFGAPFIVGANGKLRMEFSEAGNDGDVTPDGSWKSGTLTIQASLVPEVGTYGLMALGLLGVAAAVRRRKA